MMPPALRMIYFIVDVVHGAVSLFMVMHGEFPGEGDFPCQIRVCLLVASATPVFGGDGRGKGGNKAVGVLGD